MVNISANTNYRAREKCLAVENRWLLENINKTCFISGNLWTTATRSADSQCRARYRVKADGKVESANRRCLDRTSFSVAVRVLTKQISLLMSPTTRHVLPQSLRIRFGRFDRLVGVHREDGVRLGGELSGHVAVKDFPLLFENAWSRLTQMYGGMSHPVR
jgi:hypothetical protein